MYVFWVLQILPGILLVPFTINVILVFIVSFAIIIDPTNSLKELLAVLKARNSKLFLLKILPFRIKKILLHVFILVGA